MPEKTITTSDVSKVTLKEAGEMISADWKRWFKNLLIFSIPSFAAFFLVLGAGRPMQDAVIALYGAVGTALIDLYKKYQDEVKYVPKQ